MTDFTTNLEIALLNENSDQPQVPVNNGFQAVDNAITALVQFAVTNTNALVITQAQLANAKIVQLIDGGTSPTATVTITLDAFSRGDFIVDNQLAHDADIEITGQALPIPRVPAGRRRRLTMDGVDVYDPTDLPVYTVATLPAAGTARRRAWVSDGNAPVFAAAVAGGGAILTPVYDDGATWRCG